LEQEAETTATLAAIADGTECQIIMRRTKIDGTLRGSVISKKNADASRAQKECLAAPVSLTDSGGKVHTATQVINLRCAINKRTQTFNERFYVTSDCGEYDALLRQKVSAW
jgi:hypothetical protein